MVRGRVRVRDLLLGRVPKDFDVATSGRAGRNSAAVSQLRRGRGSLRRRSGQSGRRAGRSCHVFCSDLDYSDGRRLPTPSISNPAPKRTSFAGISPSIALLPRPRYQGRARLRRRPRRSGCPNRPRDRRPRAPLSGGPSAPGVGVQLPVNAARARLFLLTRATFTPATMSVFRSPRRFTTSQSSAYAMKFPASLPKAVPAAASNLWIPQVYSGRSAPSGSLRAPGRGNENCFTRIPSGRRCLDPHPHHAGWSSGTVARTGARSAAPRYRQASHLPHCRPHPLRWPCRKGCRNRPRPAEPPSLSSHAVTSNRWKPDRQSMRFKDVPNMRESKIKRFLRMPKFEEHLALHRLDCLSSHGSLANYDFARNKQQEVPPEQLRPVPLVTGHDLIAAGRKPGPAFGAALHEAEDAQLEGNVLPEKKPLKIALARIDSPNSIRQPLR